MLEKVIKRLIKSEYVFFLLLLTIAFVARTYKISSPVADWHSWRQADTASVSKIYLQNGLNVLYPKYHDISTIQSGIFNPEGYRFVEFPIYNIVNAFLAANFDYYTLEIWGRLVSIIASLTSGILIFYILKTENAIAAYFSSAVFLLLPYGIYYSRTILPEPLAVCFGLSFLLLFRKYIETDKLVPLLFSGVFFSLSLLVKPFTFFFSLPAAYLLYDKYGVKKMFRNLRLYLFSIIVIVPFILWRYWVSNFPEGTPFFWWVFNGDGIRFKPSFWYWIFSERVGQLILGVWGSVFMTFAFIKSKREDYFTYSFIFGALIYLFLVAEANVRHDYYQFVTLPAISMLFGLGIYKFLDLEIITKWKKYILSISLVFLVVVSGAVEVKEYYKINNPTIIKAGLKVNEMTEKDALIVAPYNGDTAFLYQTGRWGWPFKDREIEELIDNGADYFVSVSFDDVTSDIMAKYSILLLTDDFVIIDLGNNNKL